MRRSTVKKILIRAALILAALLMLAFAACAGNDRIEDGRGLSLAEAPTEALTEAPTEALTEASTEEPTEVPTEEPTEVPTEEPTEAPTEEPTEEPTPTPTDTPKPTKTPKPTATPTPKPTKTPKPTATPTPKPTKTPKPTAKPTATPKPTAAPAVVFPTPDGGHPYFLYYEKGSHTLSIYMVGSDGKYSNLIARYRTAHGGNKTPTGTFKLGAKEKWHRFTVSGRPAYARFAVKYAGGVYLHGPLYWSQDIYDLIPDYYDGSHPIGGSNSGGCLRMVVKAIYWIYYNCPTDTKLMIVNGSPLGTSSSPVPPRTGTFDPTDPEVQPSPTHTPSPTPTPAPTNTPAPTATAAPATEAPEPTDEP